MDVNKPIHNEPPLIRGLEVLAATTPMPGNTLYN